jgi:SurA N-terminal domain
LRTAARLIGRPVISVVLLLLVSMAVSGCGATKAPAIANVQGNAISQRTLEHWSAIKRAEARSSPTPTSASPEEIRKKALAFLITAAWLQGEAAARGISVSSTEVDAIYRRLLGGNAGQAFAATMRQRGMSSADEQFQLRIAQLAFKLEREVTSGPQHISAAQRRQQISAFVAAYRQRWKQRTTCRSGYVIAECRNGPPLSESPGNG